MFTILRTYHHLIFFPVLSPPHDVSFYATPSSLEVSWVPPRAKVLGYKVFYTPENTAEGLDPSFWGHVEVWGRETGATIAGVRSDLKYLVTVKTIGRDYVESDFSEIVEEISRATCKYSVAKCIHSR